MRRFVSFICVIALLLGSVVSISGASMKDTIPPAILSSIPSTGQSNVGIDAAFTVKFKEPIAKGFNFSKIVLLNSQKKVIPLTLSIKGDILTATINSKLSWSSAYTLTIPNGAVKDLAGNALSKPYIISFNTIPSPLPLSEELKPVVAGIKKLSVSNPGPLELLNSQWLPVAAVDNNLDSIFIAARKYGNGRILALGKDDLLSGDNIYILDNLSFIKNAFKWLSSAGSKRVGYSFGHGEFFNADSAAGLMKELTKDKYLFGSTKLTATDLKTKDILIIGNPWKSLSAAEISAIENFVANGGSLILAGLGWSYHDYNPGSYYPMDLLSSKFGVIWAKTVITETSEKYKNSPVFNVFFPNIKTQEIMLKESMDYIEKTTNEHPNDLPAVLQSDSMVYGKYISSLMYIVDGVSQDSGLRQTKYDFLKKMITSYPQYYSKEPIFDTNLYPNMAWLREHFIKAWIDALPLTTVIKAEIADTARIKGTYKKIWDEFGIYIADNSSLNSLQTVQIYNVLNMIPANMHGIKVISVAELLGNKPLGLRNFIDKSDGINIFKLSVGEASENSFPTDISEGIGDIFTLVLVHEINHVIDAKVIGYNHSLEKRKVNILSSAGVFPNNYLRSMFENSFFINAPQEFFASISNEWFTSSAKTVKLGLSRFDNRRTKPINQALFFAEVYSQGENFTYFYNSDSAGNLTRTTVPLTRDSKGRIKSIAFDGYVYEFTLDDNGDVTSYTATKM